MKSAELSGPVFSSEHSVRSNDPENPAKAFHWKILTAYEDLLVLAVGVQLVTD